ncbi:hypothetical protein U8Q05_27005 (plasmid) [Rhizobium ruizarguesonis]|nr:hypothetical protein U8Q05_27005 [Rhizobium ruizarguesonis]
MISFPHGLAERARNVFDIFFDWQAQGLDELRRAHHHQLRAAADALLPSTPPELSPCIAVDENSGSISNPRIEYLRNDDPQYIYRYCAMLMLHAQDAELGQRLVRMALYKEQQRLGEPREMARLFDRLYTDLWIADLDFAAKWWLISQSSPDWLNETVGLVSMTSSDYTSFFRDLRREMQAIRESCTDLNSWWYGMFCLLPKIRAAESLARQAYSKREADKVLRFLDEAVTDLNTSLSCAFNGALNGDPTPISKTFLDVRSLAELGDVTLRDLKTSKITVVPRRERGREAAAVTKDFRFSAATRFSLPRFWYEAAVSYVEEGKLLHKGDPPPLLLDDFNPFLVAALQYCATAASPHRATINDAVS